MSKSYNTVHYFGQSQVAQSLNQVNAAGSSITLGSSNSGKVVTLNSTSGSLVNLGPPISGFTVEMITSAVGPHVVTAPSGTLYGSVVVGVSNSSSTLAITSGKTTLTTVTAGSVVGDRVRFVSDGTNFYVSGSVAKFNALTIA